MDPELPIQDQSSLIQNEASSSLLHSKRKSTDTDPADSSLSKRSRIYALLKNRLPKFSRDWWRKCCIATCTESHEILHNFPSDEPQLLLWLANTKQQPRLVHPKRLFVCQSHFDAEVIYWNKLSSWAIPTLNLGQNGYVIPNPRHNGNNSHDVNQALKYIREHHCSVLSCFQEEGEGVRLLEYPTDKAMIRDWADKCKHRSLQAIQYGFKVCQDHFAPECFHPDTGNLIEGSSPTLELEPNVQCVVPNCKPSKTDEHIRYFCPPYHSDSWCRILGMHSSDLKDERVCHRHFELHCFKSPSVLHSGSYPTLLLGQESLMVKIPDCCVPGCKHKLKPRQYYKFPDNPVLYNKWMGNLRLDVSCKLQNDLRICKRHFEKRCLKLSSTLYVGAIPTLELGHSYPVIYKNHMENLKKLVDDQAIGCCYPGCSLFIKDAVYKLPRTNPVRSVWLNYMGIDETAIRSEHFGRLCPIHYVILYNHSSKDAPECAKDKGLSSNYEDAKRRGYLLICAVKGCHTVMPRDGIKVHSLPTSQKFMQMWVENCQLDKGELLCYKRVCHKHFEPHCLSKNQRLLYWSVPTLHLPGDVVHQIPTEGQREEIWRQEGHPKENEKDVETDNLVLETSKLEKIDSTDPEADKLFLDAFRMEENDSKEELKETLATSAISQNRTIHEKICCIATCKKRELLHNFPSKEQHLLMWLVNTQHKPRSVNPRDLLLCQSHFEPDCIYLNQLRSWAVPTLNLGHNGHVIRNVRPNGNLALAQDIYRELLDIRQNYCSVLSCFQAEGDGVRLFEYPKSHIEYRVWAAKCNHDSLQAVKEGFKVCQIHFASKCFHPDTGNLIEGSAPTLELGTDVSSVTDVECLVPNCERRIIDVDTHYLRVPTNRRQLEKWCKIFTKSPADLMDQHICDRHFERNCFIRPGELRNGSIPTLFLDEKLDRRHTQIKEFCVACSKRSRECRGFFSFPQSEVRSKQWSHNLRLDLDKKQRETLKVCRCHFEIVCFAMSYQLHPGAIPTLNLRHRYSDLYTPDENTIEENWEVVEEEMCCYPDCLEFGKELFYHIPREKWRLEWLQYMSIDETAIISKDSLPVCPLHLAMLYEHSARSSVLRKALDADQFLAKMYEEVLRSGHLDRFKCAVKICNMLRPRDGVTLYYLPSMPQILQKWVDNCQLNMDGDVSNLRVCRRHFEPDCLRNEVRLFRWSVPTLRLPGQAVHQNPDNIEWRILRSQEALLLKQEEEKRKKENSLLEPLVKVEYSEPEPTEPINMVSEPYVTMERIDVKEEMEPEQQYDLNMPHLEVELGVSKVESFSCYERTDEPRVTAPTSFTPSNPKAVDTHISSESNPKSLNHVFQIRLEKEDNTNMLQHQQFYICMTSPELIPNLSTEPSIHDIQIKLEKE